VTKRDLPGELDSKIIVAFLKEHGWTLKNTTGSHCQFSKAGHDTVTVPHPRVLATRRKADVFKSILRQARMTRDDFAAWYYSGRIRN
jgi:predicted RNA binding protein YcfA (HicA-like mRNA interferase family)